MIAALTGRLASKAPSTITLDVQGVGYEIFIPLSTFYSLPDSDADTLISLHIRTHLKQDTIQLFGFLTNAEKDVFVLLTGIGGIGPRLALSILSALSVPEFAGAVQTGDVDTLASVPGIGKKSASRIVLELKDKTSKIRAIAPWEEPVVRSDAEQLRGDAHSALLHLGYRASEVKSVVKRVLEKHSEPLPLKDLIREALKELAKA